MQQQHKSSSSRRRAAAAPLSHTAAQFYARDGGSACVCVFLGGGGGCQHQPVKTTGVRAQVKQWVTQCPTRGTFKALCILGTLAPMWLPQCGLGTRTSLLALKQHIMVLSRLAAQKLA